MYRVQTPRDPLSFSCRPLSPTATHTLYSTFIFTLNIKLSCCHLVLPFYTRRVPAATSSQGS